MKQQKHKRRPVWRQVKRAWIVVLLALNVLLLAVLGAVKGYDAWCAHQTRSRMDSMLAQKGILCGSSVYHVLEDCPQAYTLRTDGSTQKAFTRALLTGTVTTEAKGSSTVWNGDNGSVEWASSGAVNARVKLPTVIAPQDTEQAQEVVRDLLKQAGIAVRSDQMTTEQDEAGYHVTVKQEIEKIELVGCDLTVTIAPGNDITVEGTWCTGTAQPLAVRALQNYSAEQVLLAFISVQDEAGQIISVQPAYVLSDKSGGRFTAIPCWRFTTEGGDYILNILTRDVVDAADVGADDDTEPDDTDAFQQDLDTWNQDGDSDMDADDNTDDNTGDNISDNTGDNTGDSTDDASWDDGVDTSEPAQATDTEPQDIPWDADMDTDNAVG